jgi:hypothetical protein
MKKKHDKRVFCYYTAYAPKIKVVFIGAVIFCCLIITGLLCTFLVLLFTSSPSRQYALGFWMGTILGLFNEILLIVWTFFNLFWSHFSLEEGRYETRCLFVRKTTCSAKDVVSFGQDSYGSVGLFDKDGAVLLYIIFFIRSNRRDVFLQQIRTLLLPRGVVEIFQEAADKLLAANPPRKSPWYHGK